MDGFEKARKKIEECEKHRPKVIFCVGPTGPTGPTGPQGLIGLTGATGPTGPTARLFKSSNNHRYKLNNSL